MQDKRLDNPVTPLKAVNLALTGYRQFAGRSTRPEYWWWVLVCSAIFVLVLGIFDSIIGRQLTDRPLPIARIIFLVLVFLPSVSLTTRRLHDIGRSGWLQLVVAIPLCLGIILITAVLLYGGELSWPIIELISFLVAAVCIVGSTLWAVILMCTPTTVHDN